MKIMRDKTTYQVLNWGTPPWADQDTLTNTEIVDCSVPLPVHPQHYKFDGTKFISAPITTDADIAKSSILTMAQSAVGVKLADLTTTQQKALMACLLFLSGGVDLKTMTVKALAEWIK